jgi:hypothetical protein
MEDHQQDHSAHQEEAHQEEAHQEEAHQEEAHQEEVRQCLFPPLQSLRVEETTN